MAVAVAVAVVVVSVGKPGPHYNTKMQASALESLIAKLPDPASAAPPRLNRAKVRTARQLDIEQTQELIEAYRKGATVYELGERYGINRRTAGVILKRSDVPTRGQGLSPRPGG